MVRKTPMTGIFCVICLCLALSFCAKAKEEAKPEAAAAAPEAANPFFEAYGTPFETPPFDRIRDAHFMPAFREGMARQKKEIEAVVANPEPPTFANTIEAVERSGELLTRVANVFFCLTEGNTNPALQAMEAEVSPLLAKHRDDITLDPKLFGRYKAVYEGRDKLQLDAGAGAPPREGLQELRPRRRQPRRDRQGRVPRHQRGAFPADGQVRRRRPQGDQRLHARHRQARGPGRAAPGRRRRRG